MSIRGKRNIQTTYAAPFVSLGFKPCQGIVSDMKSKYK